jgi:hypothetical protein
MQEERKEREGGAGLGSEHREYRASSTDREQIFVIPF